MLYLKRTDVLSEKEGARLHEKVSSVSEAGSGTGLFSGSERCVRFEALARGVYGVWVLAAVREPGDMKTISRDTGISVNSVRKYVDGLRDKCLIRTEPTRVQMKDGRTRNGNLRFQIRPIDEAVQDFYDRELLGIG